MAKEAVREKGVSVALACRTFGISETCYRYEAKLSDESAEIADWLVRLASSDATNVGALVCATCSCAMFRAFPGTTSVSAASIANWN